jgi:hypothetical protein
MVAHGGLVGGIVESLVVVAVVAVFAAVWLRERKAHSAAGRPARLRDDDESSA